MTAARSGKLVTAMRSGKLVVLIDDTIHPMGQTEEALRRAGLAAARAILDEFDRRRPAFAVNPEAYAARRDARGC